MSPTEPKKLRTGWTTGTCASAAAKAAVIRMLSGELPDRVEVAIPSGQRVIFDVMDPRNGGAAVIKDAGDDPDCTNGAQLTVYARAKGEPHWLGFVAGEGIGTITKPGLGLRVGAPAINPVPERMISQAVREITDLGVELIFSVPGGVEMAKKTTNDRLGILGGISLLGTTGIVRPFSTAAYRASVVQQIDVAAAQGLKSIVLATGSRSEKCAMGIHPYLDTVGFVEVGDFTGIALKRAHRNKIEEVTWVGMVGKISKLANQVMMTHFHRSDVSNDVLVEAARRAEAPKALLDAATATKTARHFYEQCFIEGEIEPLRILCQMARQACLDYVNGEMRIEVVMVDFDGQNVVARA